MRQQATAPERTARSAFMTGSSSKDLQEDTSAAGHQWPAGPARHVLPGPGSAVPACLEGLKEEQLLLEDAQDILQREWSQPGRFQQQQAISGSKAVADEATSLRLDLDAWHLPPAITQASVQNLQPEAVSVCHTRALQAN